MNIDLNNIKSITVVKSNSLWSRPNFASPTPIAIPDAFQKTGQSTQTDKGAVPMWVVANTRCLLISRHDPKVTRLTDGWVIEFGDVAATLTPQQLQQLTTPTQKKKRRAADE